MSVIAMLLLTIALIFVGQQNCGVRSIRLGDNPLFCVGLVAAEKAKAFLQAELIFLAIVFRKFSPIAHDVAREEVHRVLSAFFESGERSRRSDQLSEVE